LYRTACADQATTIGWIVLQISLLLQLGFPIYEIGIVSFDFCSSSNTKDHARSDQKRSENSSDQFMKGEGKTVQELTGNQE
jgi:hypothetical protein